MIGQKTVFSNTIAAVLLGFSALSLSQLSPQIAQASELAAVDGTIDVEVRKGRIVRLDAPAAAVFVADPEIADVQAHSPSLIYVFGRNAGSTSIYAVDENENILFSKDINVRHNLSGLRSSLAYIVSTDQIELRSIDNGIFIAGEVDDSSLAEDIRLLVNQYIGENEQILNRLDISSSTQVNLRVRFAEVSREVNKLFGVNFENAFEIGEVVFGFGTGRPFLGENGIIPLANEDGVANSVFGNYSNGRVDINGLVDALEQEGFLTVLAEPNLTAVSGETADFLAGGEFPVPVSSDDGDIEIEFKEFGVSLAFTPTVISRKRISLRVRPEVSDLSENGAIRIQDLVIPALSTRRAETTVELGSGQGFAIGGLISNTTQSNLDKFPGLGDLPILGTLFRSTQFQSSETELVILVTPYLVQPASQQQLATPTDGHRRPSDLQLFLEGRVARTSLAPGAAEPGFGPARQLVGPSGFIVD